MHDHTKHEITLNGVGYRLNNYNRRNQEPFAPRFGGGEQTMTDLDLFKGRKYGSFADGMLYRYYNQEVPSLWSIEGMYDRFSDGVMYPTPRFEEVDMPFPYDDFPTGGHEMYYSASDQLFYFVAEHEPAGGGSLNYVETHAYWYDEDAEDWVQLSVPSSWSDNQSSYEPEMLPTDLEVLGEYLYIARDTDTLWRIDLDDPDNNGVEEVYPSGGAGVSKIANFRGRLYFIGSRNIAGLFLFQEDLDNLDGTQDDYDKIGFAGDPRMAVHTMIEYNHRIFMAKPDGLFAYDGVQVIAVDSQVKAVNEDNYKFLRQVYGVLYFFMPDGFYSFNGSTIEKLYDVSEVRIPNDVAVGDNRYWFIYSHFNTEFSRYEESVGVQGFSEDDHTTRVFCYNGRGLFMYQRFEDDSSMDFHIRRIAWHKGYLYMPYQPLGDHWAEHHYKLSTSNDSEDIGENGFILITPIDDDDLPFITKHLESVDLILDGTVPQPEEDEWIDIDYRVRGFDGSGQWIHLGRFKIQGDTSFTRVVSHLWIPFADVSYQQIQLKVRYDGDTDLSEMGIAGIVKRYSLVPDVNYEWDMNLLCYGADTYEPLLLRDNTESSQSVVELRSNIYDTKESLNPATFVDLNYTTLTEAISDSDADLSVIKVDDVSLFRDRGYVVINEEIFYYYIKDSGENEFQLTPPAASMFNLAWAEDRRGLLDTGWQSHSVGDYVYPLYRVFIRRIHAERVIASEEPYKQFASEVHLTLVEA